jgi:hypothetical protein
MVLVTKLSSPVGTVNIGGTSSRKFVDGGDVSYLRHRPA